MKGFMESLQGMIKECEEASDKSDYREGLLDGYNRALRLYERLREENADTEFDLLYFIEYWVNYYMINDDAGHFEFMPPPLDEMTGDQIVAEIRNQTELGRTFGEIWTRILFSYVIPDGVMDCCAATICMAQDHRGIRCAICGSHWETTPEHDGNWSEARRSKRSSGIKR